MSARPERRSGRLVVSFSRVEASTEDDFAELLRSDMVVTDRVQPHSKNELYTAGICKLLDSIRDREERSSST